MNSDQTEGLPYVSVILTVYNGEPHVGEAIESIRQQTFKDWELILINDGSTDDTEKICQSFSENRIRMYTQENKGRGESLNRALGLAKGEYIAIIDDDDIAKPERLERQVSYLDTNDDIHLIGSWYEKQIEESMDAESTVAKPPCRNKEIRRSLPLTNPFGHSTVLYRRDAALSVGGYRTELDSCLDLDFYVRLAKADYNFSNIPEPLVVIRKHQNRSFRFHGIDRYKYLATVTWIRKQAATGLDLPVYYWGAPFVMLLWSILPNPIKTKIQLFRE